MGITLNSQFAITRDQEPERLINELRSWGINYLMGEGAAVPSSERMSAVELVQRLAQCPYPRIRDASISLFLLHPELVDTILQAYQAGEAPIKEQIAVLTLATVYMQRLWSFQLAIAFGHPSQFPEQPFARFWRQLPEPRCQYGRAGLEALQEREQKRRGLPLNFIGDWQNQIDHLLAQEEAKHSVLSAIEAGVVDDEVWGPLRSPFSQHDLEHDGHTDIEKFLKGLGRTYRKPGRLYLAGGAALVHMGLRSGSTLDIDVVIEAANEDEMVTAIRHLVDQMQINIEFASPGDFIPLPAQWMAHSRYIGRYGSIEVFYFDFYNLALSKISRGNDRDLIDVKLLVQQNIITLDELDAAYQEVLPRMGKRPYFNLNPQKFAERYSIVQQQL